MTPNSKTCIDLVLLHEGDYTNNAADPGNWTGGACHAGECIGTRFGISAPVAVAHLGFTPDADYMRHFPLEVAEQIYESEYWKPIHGDELPLPLAMCVLDAEVMSGIGGAAWHHERAAGWLQEAVGVEADGVIGPQTIAAANSCDQAKAVRILCALRLAFLQSLSTSATFGNGWQTRVQDTEAQALAAISNLPDAASAAGVSK